MRNPFSLSFGKEPVNAISRDKEMDEIIEEMTSVPPVHQAYIIMGNRGSGKTVFMTEIATVIRQNKNWIVAELSPERDILHALAAELSNRKELFQVFKDAKINLSFLGLGLEIDSEPPITDIVVALDRMLDQLTKRGKSVLVALDEAASNQYVREFASQFQIFMRKNYNIYLLMTGLYENIQDLQNEKTLTFLHRAHKHKMAPLNSTLVAKQYQHVFNISDEEAFAMAKIVKGYPYAYQVLGYLCHKRKCSYDKILDEFDAYLGEYVYDKIWSELSAKDRSAMYALATSPDGKVENVREILNMSSEEFSVYRKRLLQKGIVTGDRYGYLELVLPRFKEYIIQNVYM